VGVAVGGFGFGVGFGTGDGEGRLAGVCVPDFGGVSGVSTVGAIAGPALGVVTTRTRGPAEASCSTGVGVGAGATPGCRDGVGAAGRVMTGFERWCGATRCGVGSSVPPSKMAGTLSDAAEPARTNVPIVN
jgi:hypothetical protein